MPMAIMLRIIALLLLQLPLGIQADYLPFSIDAQHLKTYFWTTCAVCAAPSKWTKLIFSQLSWSRTGCTLRAARYILGTTRRIRTINSIVGYLNPR